MTYKTLEMRIDERGVAYVTLNIPQKRNALSAQMISELTHLATHLDNDIRCVVLSGNGPFFCAGGDLEWMKAQINADRASRITEARKLAHMFQALNTIPKPLIGCLHGGAYGGGVGLACICDTTIAQENTKFGLTETKLGLIPATIAPYVVARMGEGNARQVFMSSRIFGTQEAIRFNIVHKAVAEADLEKAIEDEIKPYLSVAPGAVTEAKKMARQLGPTIDEKRIEDTIEKLADIWEGEEAGHGIDAFLNKTKPRWAE